MVYAVVRAGGRQEKVEVGSILVVDRIEPNADGTIELAPVLHVDGDKVTVKPGYGRNFLVPDAKALAKIKVTAEVVGNERGPKINIQNYKNKTGYKRRMGFRADRTRVKITGIK